jgi:hypothetical protein
MLNDSKDLEFFKKKLLSYAVNRILPSLKSENYLKDTGILLPNLVQLYNLFFYL